MLLTLNGSLGDDEVEDLPTSDSVTSLKELTYKPECKPLAIRASRNALSGEKHTALVGHQRHQLLAPTRVVQGETRTIGKTKDQ